MQIQTINLGSIRDNSVFQIKCDGISPNYRLSLFAASCKEQHVSHHMSGAARPYPEHEAHNLLTAEQGKSHLYAIPQSKIQAVMTPVVSEGL